MRLFSNISSYFYLISPDPVSIHWNKLLDHLKLLSFNPSHHCGSCNSQHLAAVGNDNALIKEPVAAVCHVIIVEGNMLIASRELMELSSMSFFIKLDYETCKQRRL
jgi:uridine kinase